MRFKLHWGKAKVQERFRSPLKETDYDGNELWHLSFPTREEIYKHTGLLINEFERERRSWAQTHEYYVPETENTWIYHVRY